ncbi:MAG: glycosyltransferase [Calditrichaceae bacterium]|nr:glycosyltransferase [Calditrichia bacterium]NUQ42235.1 glycosyltransferase [Calditrichaceae bacterium]
MENSEKQLLFISYYFPPMGGGGVQRIVKFLKYLDCDLFQPVVLTVKPSFFYSNDSTLAGEIPGSVKVIRSGSLDPFRVLYLFRKLFRRPGSASAVSHRESGGNIRKIAMSVFVPDSRLLWLPFALGKLWRLRRRPVNVIIASMPPFTAGLIGALARRFLPAPLILDFRDAWAENPYLPAVGAVQRRLSARLEAWCIRQADGFIFVNPALQNDYQKRYPFIAGRRAITIRNGFDPEDFYSPNSPGATQSAGRRAQIGIEEIDSGKIAAAENVSGNSGVFNLGIMGTVYSQGNRPETLLEAVEELSADAAFRDHFRLIFLGKWSPDFRKTVEEKPLGGVVDFIPYLPHREALLRAGRFDALALAIETGLPGSAGVTPGRIYEYLYLKKPILALCPLDSDLADLLRRCQAGEALDYNDREGIKRVLREWMAGRGDLKNRYRFVGVEEFSRVNQARQLAGFVEEVVGRYVAG